MSPSKGMIVLMGSGELTATMVEVHKELLAGLGGSPKATFIDTPAGFQLNCDEISQRAIDYFRTRVGQHMTRASYKSSEVTSGYDADLAFRTLREADYILIGPGSPTYAVRQLRQTPLPDLILGCVERGGCLVAASAAALTVGRFTLPVYEVYKVGQELHWVEGMDTLGPFGFDLVVVPHWNNAEGGTHDTRFCFMGEPRFEKLESLLPDDVAIFGLDEHTACLMDMEKGEASIRGIGRAVLRQHGRETVFERGESFPLEALRGGDYVPDREQIVVRDVNSGQVPQNEGDSFWDEVHALEAAFDEGLEEYDPRGTANALLELDRVIWKGKEDLENEEFIAQAREIMREMIVLLGARLGTSPKSKTELFAPVVDKLLVLREALRKADRWEEADAIRDALALADVMIEDTADGARWRVGETGA